MLQDSVFFSTSCAPSSICRRTFCEFTVRPGAPDGGAVGAEVRLLRTRHSVDRRFRDACRPYPERDECREHSHNNENYIMFHILSISYFIFKIRSGIDVSHMSIVLIVVTGAISEMEMRGFACSGIARHADLGAHGDFLVSGDADRRKMKIDTFVAVGMCDADKFSIQVGLGRFRDRPVKNAVDRFLPLVQIGCLTRPEIHTVMPFRTSGQRIERGALSKPLSANQFVERTRKYLPRNGNVMSIHTPRPEEITFGGEKPLCISRHALAIDHIPDVALHCPRVKHRHDVRGGCRKPFSGIEVTRQADESFLGHECVLSSGHTHQYT